jgi:hypothetical protein
LDPLADVIPMIEALSLLRCAFASLPPCDTISGRPRRPSVLAVHGNVACIDWQRRQGL